jgi:putative endonuclease
MLSTDSTARRQNPCAGGPGEYRRTKLGKRGEAAALQYFERNGFHVVARNQHMRIGELDLVVWNGGIIVFAEVKTRRADLSLPGSCWTQGFGLPCQKQRRRQRRAAREWLADTHERPWANELRFDVIRLLVNRQDKIVQLDHLEGI